VLVSINHEAGEGDEDRMANELDLACYGDERENIKSFDDNLLFFSVRFVSFVVIFCAVR
jgi:hypothetical protein